VRIHILGVCGTFMAGIAVLAKQAGHCVSGSDLNVYPPMSTQLEAQGIQLMHGFDPAHITSDIDCVIVGNVIRRGNPAMEYVLEQNITYTSGPQWLAENILRHRWVLAVSGTHGKTTTTSILTWILESAGLNPGFLIGGVPENFSVSARMGDSPFFVIEADEYDSAFFDKRSKFIHYRPKTLILNNLEFDHADIFPDLDAIKQQFHFLIRTVPGNGLIVCNAQEPNLIDVLEKGCWTPVTRFAGGNVDWQAKLLQADGSCFEIQHQDKYFQGSWDLLGQHNVNNALAAIAAAWHAGVDPAVAVRALKTFKNVKRRLEVRGKINDITVYDDFAHHPTAIATTLAGLRAKIGKARLVAVLEFGSYTMRSGVHRDNIRQALNVADMVVCKSPETNDWELSTVLKQFSQPTILCDNVDSIIENLLRQLKPGDHVVIMSNSGFGGIHQKLLHQLAASCVQ
jgi:UDP-N-acetylmuramate: L-alanyl-gamma-D-glutamyl-meso-diaminopimelate ligase